MISELAIVLALILANGVFSGAEIALIAVRGTRVKELVERGGGAVAAVVALRKEPERLLATVQVGITVVGTTAAAFGGAALADRLIPLLTRVSWMKPYAPELALGIVVALISYLSIIVGELVPKSLALRSAEQYALLVARPLLALSWLAKPLVWLLTQSSNLLLKPFGDRTTFTEARYSTGEIQQLVEDARRSGSLHPHAAEIASRALDFPELTALEVMVPRREVIMLPLNATAEDVHAVMAQSSHTRLPVHDENTDDIVGYVHIKDLAAQTWQHGTIRIRDIIRPPHFVPGSLLAVNLLRDMQKERIPLAVVVDEQGGMEGIVAIEDLLEELVGEIFSEHAREVPQMTREPSGDAIVPGTTPIRDLNRALGLELPDDGDWNTIAGLYIGKAGHIPTAGEQLTLPNGIRVEVVDASARRIRTVRIHRVQPQGDESSDRDGG